MLKYWIIVCFTKILFIYIFFELSLLVLCGQDLGPLVIFDLKGFHKVFLASSGGFTFWATITYSEWMTVDYTQMLCRTWPQGCIYMIKWWWRVGGMILATTASVLRESLFAIYVLFIISRHIHHYWYTNVWQHKGKANSEYLNISNVC